MLTPPFNKHLCLTCMKYYVALSFIAQQHSTFLWVIRFMLLQHFSFMQPMKTICLPSSWIDINIYTPSALLLLDHSDVSSNVLDRFACFVPLCTCIWGTFLYFGFYLLYGTGVLFGCLV